jgi:hypothetical protein
MGFLLAAVTSIALARPVWPLQSSASAKYLTDQLGRPFLVTADAAWCLINGLTDQEIDTYLNTRQAQGFNAVQLMLMAQHSGCAVGGGSVDRYGQSPFLTGDDDWSVPNEAYWSRVDRILDKLEARGMLALATPAYLGFSCYYGTQGWCAAMADQPVERMSSFGAFLGRRYRSQGNIIWIAGGDADPLQYTGIDERVDALMSALKTAEAGRHLMTGHAGRGVTGFESFGAHSWLTLNSAYDGESCPDDTMASQIVTERQRSPHLPILSIEQMFDAEGADERCLADQFFWAVLEGGVGHTYGNGYVWSFSPGWDSDSGIHSPRARVQTNAAKLIRSRRYWLFEPDTAHQVVIAGYGSGASTVATSRASTGESVMSYVPEGGTMVTVDMSRLTGARATAYWYDPATGVATSVGTFVTQGPMSFVSPGDARVLVLDDAAQAFPAPGSRDIQQRRRPSLREPRPLRGFFSRD